MKSKFSLKAIGSAFLLGSSLASIISTTGVSATKNSIKNFFFKNETKNEKKKLSLKEKKEKYNLESENSKGTPKDYMLSFAMLGAIFSLSTALSVLEFKDRELNPTGYYTHPIARAAGRQALVAGFIITALISAGIGCCSYYKCNKSIKKGFEELSSSIKESMLKEQWNFDKFQKMVSDKDTCKEFLEQLLVLEPSTSNDEEKEPKNNLNEKVKALQDLFSKDPETLLKEAKPEEKDIYKELIFSLSDWCYGKMEKLYDPSYGRSYFIAQNDIELLCKIVLLRKIVLGRKYNYPKKIDELTMETFNENIKNENMKNFRKLLLLDIRNYISEQDANDETIIKILTELTEPNETGQQIDYYKKIKTFSEEKFNKEKQNRVLLGLKNFFENKGHFSVITYISKRAYESCKRET